jgi:major membrane immunogen (membrane-anchored lipoprotein)
MIKKTILAFTVLILVAFSVYQIYKDGIYKGISRSVYTDEPYYGHLQIVIENGKIIIVEFFVRDSAKHENVDDKYEKYFTGNNEYIKQCRNDWKGIQSYPDSLIKYQDLNKVDVISGATWSYNIFRASCQEALSGAENPK